MIDEIDALDSGALFSPCRRWRYLLWRRWDPSKHVCAFVGLNPSTADETQDDPTIRRCIRFARDWDFGALWMLNAYAFRATDPKVMQAQGANAVGPQNTQYLVRAAMYAERVVAAWGVHIDELREHELRRLFVDSGNALHVLGLTKDGHPRHPLYRPADTIPVVWRTDGLARRLSA